MAVRFDAPIYTTEQVLNEAGILLEIDQNSEASSPDISADNSDISDFRKLSMEELNSLLEDAVKEEDYDQRWKFKKNLKEGIRK